MSKNTTSLIPQGNIALDSATANMGSPWKMPTKNQCQDLIDGTNHTWTTINGVNGGKFTSKTDSSKYVFLPAAGYWSYTSFFDAALCCHYWTTLLASTGYAREIRFDKSNEIIPKGSKQNAADLGRDAYRELIQTKTIYLN